MPLTRRLMISTAVSMLVVLIAFRLLGWFFASSVMVVPPARSMPSRGVVCPDRDIPPVSATMAMRISASERPGLLWALDVPGPFWVLPPSRFSLSSRPAPGTRADRP
ncbi:hypothetical protein SBADM41S_05012 [Streptomyces badius]